MKIIEVPDYVELTDHELRAIISEVVAERTDRDVQSVEIYSGRSGRGGEPRSNEYHCKVFLSKQRAPRQGELL